MKKIIIILLVSLAVACNESKITRSLDDRVQTHFWDSERMNGYSTSECFECHDPSKEGSYYKLLFFKNGKYYVTPFAVVPIHGYSYLEVTLVEKFINNKGYWEILCKNEEFFHKTMRPFWVYVDIFRYEANRYYFSKNTDLLSKKMYEVWMQVHPETIILKGE